MQQVYQLFISSGLCSEGPYHGQSVKWGLRFLGIYQGSATNFSCWTFLLKTRLIPMLGLFLVTGCRNHQFEVGVWETLAKRTVSCQKVCRSEWHPLAPSEGNQIGSCRTSDSGMQTILTNSCHARGLLGSYRLVSFSSFSSEIGTLQGIKGKISEHMDQYVDMLILTGHHCCKGEFVVTIQLEFLRGE